MCCDNLFNDADAQRPPQFHERPRKLQKKKSRMSSKKCKILEVRRRGGFAKGGLAKRGPARGPAEERKCCL